jgi:hypothetical protein
MNHENFSDYYRNCGRGKKQAEKNIIFFCSASEDNIFKARSGLVFLGPDWMTELLVVR